MSSGMDITLEIDQGSVDAFFAQIERARKDFNFSMGRAVGTAVSALLAQLRKSTLVAPKTRLVYGMNNGMMTALKGRKLRSGLEQYAVEGWFGRPRVFMTKIFKGVDLGEVMEKHGIIHRRGLARAVWKAAWKPLMTSFMAAMEAEEADADTVMKSDQYVATSSMLEGDDCWVKVVNTLQYAAAAFAMGVGEVDSAMEVAARSMEHNLDNQLVRSMGLGSLSK